MKLALKIHKKLRGKVEICPKIKVSKKNIGLVYTPGVVEATRKIAKNPEDSFKYTGRGNNVAIITDGSRTLGVGDNVPEASLPVMEGKSLFLKHFAGVDAYPLCLKTKSKKEIVKTIENLSPSFGAFNIEDIRAPRSLEIMEELEKRNLIVFQDDEQGVAVVVLAALLNALRVVKKRLDRVRICLGGAGTAGYGIFKILNYLGLKNLVFFDAKGILFRGRKGDNKFVREIASQTNRENLRGGKKEAIRGSDVFIGLTGVGNLLDSSDIKLMKKNPIIFGLSNPNPEILPKEIKKAARDYIFASGRDDFENQINNVIVFPGIFRGLLDRRKKMDLALEVKIAKAVAGLVKRPRKKYIIPNPFDKRLLKIVAGCV